MNYATEFIRMSNGKPYQEKEQAGAPSVWFVHLRGNAALPGEGRSGHLWQNHFYPCPLGPRRLATAPACVDRSVSE
jgi:hypothetical protein